MARPPAVAMPVDAFEVPTLRVSRGRRHPSRPHAAVRQDWHSPEGELIASGEYRAGAWTIEWARVGTFRFSHSPKVTVDARAGTPDALVHDIYHRGVLPMVCLSREHEVLHASAVLVGGAVVGFCAQSGTGKSTIAAACAAGGGLVQWADDSLVLRITASGVAALSLPYPTRLDGDATRVVPTGTRRTAPPGSTAPLRAIYVLERAGTVNPSEPEVEREPPSEAFETLLAHAHPFELSDAGRPRRLLERLLQVAATAPVFRVRFCPDLSALPMLASAIVVHAESL